MSSPHARLPHPPLLQHFPFTFAVRRLAPGDIRATPQQRDAFRAFTTLGDPAADAVVELFHRLPPGAGRQLFEQALTHGLDTLTDPPAELVQLFGQVETVPYWVDPDRLDLGARTLCRTGLAGHLALSMALMGGYMAAQVVKPLIATGDLERIAPKRLAETMAWHSAVSTPGGLAVRAAGYQATVRVRLMHAMVRAGMLRRADWNTAAWGHPLHQSGMAGTLMLFALIHILGTQALGVRFTDAERESVFHVWRYVGHLLGISPELIPADEPDWWRLAWLEADSEFHSPDHDSIALAQALDRALGLMMHSSGTGRAARLARRVTAELVHGYAQLVLGREITEFLHLPAARRGLVTVAGAALVLHLLEYLRPLVPGATRWCQIAGRRVQLAAVERAMSAHGGSSRYDRHDGLPGRRGAPHPPPARLALAGGADG